MAAIIANDTLFVPALNGSYINEDYCTPAICSLDYAELDYIPSLGGNLTYLIIFAFLFLAQASLGALYRTWGFMTGILCGVLLEIVGYGGRLGLNANVFSFGSFITYLVCLTIAPAFISAAMYACLSRLIVVYGSGLARFSPKTYTLVFVCCDVVSLILQAAGGALASTATPGTTGTQTGVNIMIAGLAFQVVSLTLFMVLGVDIIIALRRAREDQLNPSFSSLRRTTPFRLFPYAIVVSTLTIFIRCCFRVAELKNGFSGALANNQTMFMIFEGPMIIVAVLSLTLCHPGLAFGGSAGWKEADWSWKHKPAYSKKIPLDSAEYIPLQFENKAPRGVNA